MSTPLENYLKEAGSSLNAAMTAYVANLQTVSQVAPEIAADVVNELENQRSHLKLVASENYCSLSTQLAMGNLLTDKYAEGFPEHRYYGGCVNIDAVENTAAREAEKLFGADYAYVQPHSGADANLVAYWAILSKTVEMPTLEELGVKSLAELSGEQFDMLRKRFGNQRLMGLDYSCGGHLTHGYKMNVSARMFESHPYGVDEKTGLLDYDAIEKQAMEVKPLILLTGFSAYPRKINFKRFRQIADKCGAVLMVDMAHFAGLVAGKVFTGEYNPVEWADVVTSTTHKTLRGPRGALILCKKEFTDYVNKGCPMVLGGPLGHVMAAKAVALKEANTQAYRDYASNVVKNAQALAKSCMDKGMILQTGGTENHLMLIDVTTYGLTGKQAEAALFKCGVTANANALPYDKNGAWWTSGIRIGTPGLTTLGMNEKDMEEVASIIDLVLKGTKPGLTKEGKPAKGKIELDPAVEADAKKRVQSLLSKHVLYPELDLQFLKKEFVK
ncbi:glycine hydroxymethyltransferase [Treponema rectale]|uniref:Serine hydroxymethyltransferase n=1 Tax=Treponema rectale TaxID=744512 RepID=A0A840SDJ2_9SPIR|nr:glycine hydroxymethyltransferase [Treponema rectale]MBB5218006.1 glycine hydroxymethyltransferase [Treponema rectale]QOS40279.1 glycine hydroxymethyltransferase [Treponema rectale]